MVKVTKVQLLQIMPTAASRIDKYLSYINSYAEVFEIDTQLRMAHYLAQIAHESGELRWTVEQGSKGYFDKYDTGKLAKMLVVGEMDDNVDPSSSYQVVNALIKANKDFEFILIPGAHHTMGESYGEHKRYDFFVKNLLGVEPPAWNELNKK